jgi:mRNA degradation ribonuclease J1/J2
LKSEKKKLKIIPLGGLEEIGMNITAFEYAEGAKGIQTQRRHLSPYSDRFDL